MKVVLIGVSELLGSDLTGLLLDNIREIVVTTDIEHRKSKDL